MLVDRDNDLENYIDNKTFIYLNLKDYVGITESYKAGDFITNIPKDMDARDVLQYRDIEDYKENMIKDLIQLAKNRNDVDFTKLRNRVSNKNIIMLEKIRKSNNFNQAFVNRFVDGRKTTVAVMVITSTDTYVAKNVTPTTKYRDDAPFIMLYKVMNYINKIVKFKLDIVNMGYYLDEKEISKELGKILYFTPTNKSTKSPQLCQIFNYYLETDELLIPALDISEQV